MPSGPGVMDARKSAIVMGVFGAIGILIGLTAGGPTVFQQTVATQYLVGGVLLMGLGAVVKALSKVLKALHEIRLALTPAPPAL